MIELPQGIGPDDLGQWLYGGICLAKSGDVFYPCLVDRVENAGRNPATGQVELQCRGRLSTDNFRRMDVYWQSDLRAHWPICGSVNLPEYKVALHVERVPMKQYKRTFNSKQVRYLLPRAWDVRKVRGSMAHDTCCTNTTTTINAIFSPTYPDTYEGALAMLSDGWMTVAINPRIIIAGDDVGKRMVYYRGKLAATINGNTMSPVADELTCSLIHRATGGRYVWTT